jgi:hypothetical protein
MIADVLHTMLVFGRRRYLDAQIRRLARDVAVRSRDALADRLKASLETMSRSEARGYIRARMAQVVRSNADKLLAGNRSLPVTMRNEVVRLAMEYLLAWVLSGRHRSVLAPERRRRAA